MTGSSYVLHWQLTGSTQADYERPISSAQAAHEQLTSSSGRQPPASRARKQIASSSQAAREWLMSTPTTSLQAACEELECSSQAIHELLTARRRPATSSQVAHKHGKKGSPQAARKRLTNSTIADYKQLRSGSLAARMQPTSGTQSARGRLVSGTGAACRQLKISSQPAPKPLLEQPPRSQLTSSSRGSSAQAAHKHLASSSQG